MRIIGTVVEIYEILWKRFRKLFDSHTQKTRVFSVIRRISRTFPPKPPTTPHVAVCTVTTKLLT